MRDYYYIYFTFLAKSLDFNVSFERIFQCDQLFRIPKIHFIVFSFPAKSKILSQCQSCSFLELATEFEAKSEHWTD